MFVCLGEFYPIGKKLAEPFKTKFHICPSPSRSFYLNSFMKQNIHLIFNSGSFLKKGFQIPAHPPPPSIKKCTLFLSFSSHFKTNKNIFLFFSSFFCVVRLGQVKCGPAQRLGAVGYAGPRCGHGSRGRWGCQVSESLVQCAKHTEPNSDYPNITGPARLKINKFFG